MPQVVLVAQLAIKHIGDAGGEQRDHPADHGESCHLFS